MPETLDAAPLFYCFSKICIPVACCFSAMLLSPLFGVVATKYNQEENCLQHNGAKMVWFAGIPSVALLNELVAFLFPYALFVFLFPCHKLQ